jgi:hypothetical protein
VNPVSFVRLGWHFALRLLARGLSRPRGLARFRASYGPERLFELAPDEQEAIASLSRCIACGVCDAHFGGYERVARSAMRAPSDVVLAHSRSLPDWDALALPLAQLERGDLARMERLCPTQIPLARVAEVARRRISELHRAEQARSAGDEVRLREGPPEAARLPRGEAVTGPQDKHDPG